MRQMLALLAILLPAIAMGAPSEPEWTPRAYLKASNTGEADNFGGSIAVDGDTIVVGAHYEDSGPGGDPGDDSAPTAGAVYVYVRNGSGWAFQAMLKSPAPESNDFFGWSVAISGNTLVVGAHQEDGSSAGVNGDPGDNGMFNSGAAYVFVRTGSVWTLQAYLKASNTGFADFFAYSVGISGDTIVVGGPNEDSLAPGVNGDQGDTAPRPLAADTTNAGAAYVFVRSGTTWTQQAYLKASNPESQDNFGFKAAIDGDTIAVGAMNEDSGATGVGALQSDNSASSSGAVYVFVRSGTTWSQQAYLKASNAWTSARFGYSLAVSGDTLAVGATGQSGLGTGVDADQGTTGAQDSGAAYIFVRNGSSWTQQVYLKASNAQSTDQFGQTLSISGDTVVVGAHAEASGAVGVDGNQADNSASGAGAAYVFQRTGSTWVQSAYLKATNAEKNDHFGQSVAVRGTLIAVGASLEAGGGTGVGADQADNSAPMSGAAYVYTRNAPPSLPSNLAQSALDGAAVAPDGATHGSFSVNATLSHPGGEAMVVQVELKPAAVDFDGTMNLRESVEVPSGSSASLPMGVIFPGRYHWQARARDAKGKTSNWVPFPGTIEILNDLPTAGPAIQLMDSDGARLAPGSALRDTQGGVRFEAAGSDINGDAIRLQVEVAQVGAEFSGRPTAEGSLVPSGDTASVRVDLPRGRYHWQHRIVDAVGGASGWVAHASGGADFEITWEGSRGLASCTGSAVAADRRTILLLLPALAILALRRRSKVAVVALVLAGASIASAQDNVKPQAYLKASNSASDQLFGWSVAVDGDLVVVGAYSEDSLQVGGDGSRDSRSSMESGAAYVFAWSGSAWAKQAYLKSSNHGTGDYFGYSVALSGDTLVVGAPREDSGAKVVGGSQTDEGAQDSGAAYVFVRSGTTWTQQAYLKPSNTRVNLNFGWSVSISGDTVVVGAYGEGSNATGVNGTGSETAMPQSGAAYVFTRSGTTWSQQAYLKASNTGASDQFGRSVGISGDTIVVGAFGEDGSATGVNGSQGDGASDSGAAYVFARSGTMWAQQAYLKASNTGASDCFGWSVAISGDTVVVGANGEDSGSAGVNHDQGDGPADTGAVYVFVRTGATWAQHSYVKASNPGMYDNFGRSVAISGDRMVVGAFAEDSNATGVDGDGSDNSEDAAGAAYVFKRMGGTWLQTAYLKATNAQSSDQFGWSVAIDGDEIVVGAPNEDGDGLGVDGDPASNLAQNSGAAYLYHLVVPPTWPGNSRQVDRAGASLDFGASTHAAFRIAANLTDVNHAGLLRLQVEVKPADVAFDGTGLLESAAVLSGVDVSVEAGGPAPGPYRWRCRSINADGLASMWISHGMDRIGTVDVLLINAIPVAGAGIQVRMRDQSTLPAGWSISDDEDGVRFEVVGVDADQDEVRLQVEIREVGIPLEGTPTAEGSPVAGGAASCFVDPPRGRYHWGYRIVDAMNEASAWTAFGSDPSQVDFEVGYTGSRGDGRVCGSSASGSVALAALLAAAVVACRRR